MLQQAEVNKKNFDLKAKEITFEIGDLVLLFSDIHPIGTDSRLICNVYGPYEILEKFNNSYKLRHTETNKVTSFINASRLKKARMPQESIVRQRGNDKRNIVQNNTQTDNTQTDNLAESLPRTHTHLENIKSRLRENRHTRNEELSVMEEQPRTVPTDNSKQHKNMTTTSKEIEQILNLRQCNGQKHYFVKFKNSDEPKWLSTSDAIKNNIAIPQNLVKEILRSRTWSGTDRKHPISK